MLWVDEGFQLVLRFVERPNVELVLLQRQPLLGDRAKGVGVGELLGLALVARRSDVAGGWGYAG